MDGLPAVWRLDVRGCWPSIAMDEHEFRAHLERIGRPAPVFPIDTYLAAACAAGDRGAIRVLDDEFVARVPAVVGRIDAAGSFTAEVAQLLRVRLLVAEADPPRIARYTGEVPLSAWIRVIAVRLALNLKRDGARGDRQATPVADADLADPEVDYLRAQYREPFVRSFQAAVGTLSRDDWTILRLHYLDGVSIDGIGRIFQVHRATVARWLVRIRAEVLGRARELLAAAIGAEVDETDSVIGALAGEVEASLSRVLAATAPDLERS